MISTRKRSHGLLAATVLCASFAACTPASEGPSVKPADSGSKPTASASAAPAATDDTALTAFSARFLAAWLERDPVQATAAGEHRHDGRYPDVSVEGEAADHLFFEGALKELSAIPVTRLSLQGRVDHAILENQLRSWLFDLDELHERAWNPMAYTTMIGEGLDPLLSRSFAPAEVRMKSVRGRLDAIPGIVAIAKKRLAGSPELNTKTAIAQNSGLLDLCKKGLAEHIAAVPAQKADLEASAKRAAAALEDFQTFLEKDLLPRSKGDFRLGRARFEKKLRFTLDDPTLVVDTVVAGARARLAQTQDDMLATSKELWPTLMKGAPLPPDGTPEQKKALIRKVLDAVAEDHPTNATIVADATHLLAEATTFVKAHDLVRVPDEPCTVIEMPEYRRGVAVAYCDATGPLEQKPETSFAISPTPADWTKKRADSFYREYNHSMLADLTVHEAMPGHFLQLMHNNQFPSKLRAVLSSGAFVEGWAVYSEWVMARAGFGGPKVRLMEQKMILRLCVNAILDNEVHAGTLDEKGALALMTGEAFQEEGEAVGKWKRAQLTSAQLTTYFYGFSEMMSLRAQLEKAPGFTERAYHDKLLSFGSPSMRHIRAIMTGAER
ncbi:MAG: DUF885 domain-containing protein [Byssovorax sp.]